MQAIRVVDRSKTVNRKCEHCKFYDKNEGKCHEDKFVVIQVPYWQVCDAFRWREHADFKPNQIPAVRVLAQSIFAA